MKRWISSNKWYININQPNYITLYKKHMGGVDSLGECASCVARSDTLSVKRVVVKNLVGNKINHWAKISHFIMINFLKLVKNIFIFIISLFINIHFCLTFVVKIFTNVCYSYEQFVAVDYVVWLFWGLYFHYLSSDINSL